MKETAIEWLYKEMYSMFCTPDMIVEFQDMFEEAKAMEKEQHKETYSIGWTTRERFDDLVPDIIYPEGLDYEEKQEYAFEQYYQQNYGK